MLQRDNWETRSLTLGRDVRTRGDATYSSDFFSERWRWIRAVILFAALTFSTSHWLSGAAYGFVISGYN